MLSFLRTLPLKKDDLELWEENFMNLKDGGCCKGNLFYSEHVFANQGFSIVLKNLV